MADFARVLATIDQVAESKSLPAYLQRLEESHLAVLDSDPFATAIRALLGNQAEGFLGSAAELLKAVPVPNPLPRDWPKTPRGTSGKVRRLAPALRASGIEVDFGKTNGERWVRLAKQKLGNSATE